MRRLPLILLLISTGAEAGRAYPHSPNLEVTPGSLCDTPDSFRYPEQIPYCERNLNSFTKELIFIAYRKLGHSLSGERNQYKVDHFIPLCAGGSNNQDNLWPQYYTISKRTDLLETLVCEVLAKGKITQREAIDLITKAKMDNSLVPGTMKYLRKADKRN